MDNLSIGTRVDHEKYGEGIISRTSLTSYHIVFLRGGEIQFSKSGFEANILEEPENSDAEKGGLNIQEFEDIITQVMEKYGAIQQEVPLGNKWEGGTMILQPANLDLKPKEIPIEIFFHKIVMLRDRMRVLEQSINSNKKLSDEEKVNIQQYITRAYGSLTTFNVLFDDKEYYFKGAKS